MRFACAAIVCGVSLAPVCRADERMQAVESLKAEYEQAAEAFDKQHERHADDPLPTAEQSIASYDGRPDWTYLPRFVQLAQQQPDDDAAFECFLWVQDRARGWGITETALYDADGAVWDMVARHHLDREDLHRLCLSAMRQVSPQREQFLRRVMEASSTSREEKGFATMALAELLAAKHDLALSKEMAQGRVPDDPVFAYIRTRWSAEWMAQVDSAPRAEYRREAMELCREVLREYADVPVTISEPYFRNLENLGEKASKSLHALEHLVIGAEAPEVIGVDLDGDKLDLKDYRGKVVVLSFWFPGCGPCISLVPKEKQLLKAFEGRPVALLGVCQAATVEEAAEVAGQHGMDWPIWFDGAKGPICRDYNIMSWPTIYLIDQEGRIVATDLHGDDLEERVEKLLGGAAGDSALSTSNQID